MRKLLLTCALIAVAAPAVAFAGKRAPGDGTLQVREGDGVVFVQVRGSVIGRCSTCMVTIDDPVPGDGSGAIVFGDDSRWNTTETAVRYVDKSPRANMRFRIIGGLSKVTIVGEGVSLSVVGRGFARLQADPFVADAGDYALDGGEFLPLPLAKLRVPLGAATTTSGG